MWNQIIGHTRQIDEFKKTLSEGKLPHAWLFCGMRGIGKRLVAETFARAILCESDNAPCGTCTNCKKSAAHMHPDLFIVEPPPEKTSVLIDQIRDLTRRVQLHPLEARAKVAIIDDADTMTEAAENSILKVLEEPPSATYFILVSAAAHRMLPTIRSRCRRVVFSPLDDAAIAAHLERVQGWDACDAARAAQIAQGSLGRARELSPEFITEVVGRFELLCADARAVDVIAASEAWSADQEHIPLVFDTLASVLRARLRNEVTGTRDPFATRRLLDKIAHIAAARDAAETTANKQLLFEQLLFSVTA